MALNIPGVIMMVIFYMFVLGIGIWAAVKSKKLVNNTHSGQVEVSFLANRSVGLMVGVFTMTATWVGGAFVMGIAESVYDPTKGLIWTLIPLHMSTTFTIGGLFFAKPMREKNYISMMDPFQRKYGKPLTAVLSIVPVIGDVFWIPGLMISLGATMKVVLDLPFSVCVWISAAVAILYTFLGESLSRVRDSMDSNYVNAGDFLSWLSSGTWWQILLKALTPVFVILVLFCVFTTCVIPCLRVMVNIMIGGAVQNVMMSSEYQALLTGIEDNHTNAVIKYEYDDTY